MVFVYQKSTLFGFLNFTSVKTKPSTNLGVVSSCTLTGAKAITVDNRRYCLSDKGQMAQSKGMELCSSLDALLPLPKSMNEISAFKKITGKNSFWIGIKDPTRSGMPENWKDATGNPIGTRFVNARVTNLFKAIKFKFITFFDRFS